MNDQSHLKPWANDVSLNGDRLNPTGHIEWFIQYLLTIHARFGDVCINVPYFSWGASALWALSDHQKKVERLEAELAAEREAVRVAAATAIKNANIDWEERGSCPMTWEDFVDQEFRANPILSAAIKAAQEKQA